MAIVESLYLSAWLFTLIIWLNIVVEKTLLLMFFRVYLAIIVNFGNRDDRKDS